MTLKSILATAALLATSLVHAQATMGWANSVTITGIDVRNSGYFLITLSSPMNGQPACATNHVRMTGDASTAGGKALLSAAYVAYTSQKTLQLVQGTGTCDQYTGFESTVILQIGPAQ